MAQEDEELLLKYLCMALPYGVICNDNRHGSGRVTNIDITPDDIEQKNGKVVVYYFDFDECGELKNCKPYLRLLSNMTEEEKAELLNLLFDKDAKYFYIDGEGVIDGTMSDLIYPSLCPINMVAYTNWLLKNHFDFMGLIPKGLAIEINKENNPYKE